MLMQTSLNRRPVIIPRIAWLLVVLFSVFTNYAVAADEDDQPERFPGGAPLKTDPELERLLERAEKFAEDGRYDLASILWQKVLEESSDTLMTRDGRKYTSLAEEVERTIAKLPETGLRVYRITADGEAKAIIASGKGDEEAALAGVVKKYFLSTLGDDAAYKLGCLALDRHDFVGATRLFGKIVEQHPDPSVPKADLWLRLAVAAAHVGDAKSAAAAIAELESSAGPKPADAVIAAVKDDLKRMSESDVSISSSSDNWEMLLGGPARRGHMKKLPDAVTKATLTKMWNYGFPINFSQASETHARGSYISGRKRAEPVETAQSDKELITRWKAGGWTPAGQLLVSDGRIFFKTNNDLTCWDASAESDQPIWRTAWLNQFQLDSMTSMMSQMYRNMGVQSPAGKNPLSPAEVMLFGDRIQQSFSLSNGMIYSVEGRRVPRHGGGAVSASNAQPTAWQYGVMPRRTRVNWLAAYDAKTGKARWHRGPNDKDTSEPNDVGFMSAPVPYGNFLLVPVSDSGTMWLYALNKGDGSTVWKSYLCDEPAGGTDPWSPIGISVDGREAYVICGSGVVFAVDAVSGDIRFAVRYERNGNKSQVMQNFGFQGSEMLNLSGWSEDIAIPFGRQLIVFSSDHDALFAIDRRTGEQLWRTPRTPYEHPSSYCLGVVGSKMFVAGKNVVRRYDLDKDGKLMWELDFEDSFGRGVVTDDAVYMPVKDSVVRIDLESGKLTNQVGVHLNSADDDPVGNLYSDGEKLWVLAGNNVFALTNRDQRLSVLGERIRAGNAGAYIERMQLMAKDGQIDAAVKDLVDAFTLMAKTDSQESAFATLLDGMNVIKLPTMHPQIALNIIAEHCVDSNAKTGSKVESPDALNLLDGIVQAALQTVRKSESKGFASSILKIAPLLQKRYQQTSARQALKSTVTENDIEHLRTALADSSAIARIIAVDAYVGVAKEQSVDTLVKLLESPDEHLQHAAARGLAQLNDRRALGTFVKLLESDDPQVRLQNVQALRSLTGKNFEFLSHGPNEKRAPGVKAWQEWLADAGATAELKLPLPDGEPLLGRTLMSYYNQNLIVEVDESGKETWRKADIQGVWACQGLPNGHRVVALYASNAVVEFDETGKEVWRKDGLPGNPFGVQRLLDGNTLVACSDSDRVIEYWPNGEIAWEARVSGRPMEARRLENGNTLVACSNEHRVVEVNPEGKVVWQVDNMQGAISVQRLENGNTLVAQMNQGKVVEVDTDGKVVWERGKLVNPYDAQRLPNGNTIIADNNGVKEYDTSGKTVWEFAGQGASGVSRF